ncbi:hypothetical protein MMC14_005621 [Varicellaria rhodocarpa]|nr:hypothetical protein [Varicellaria rhodocarpa]
MASKPNPFALHPIIPSDIPTLAHISNDSFANDRNTQLKNIGKNDANAHLNGSIEGAKYYLSMPDRLTGLKATDDATGETLGYVFWGFHGYSETGKGALKNIVEEEAIASSDGAVKKDTDDGAERNIVQDLAPSSSTSTLEIPFSSAQKTPLELETMTSADMARWQSLWTSKKHMFLGGITVSPSHHSRGVGTALLRWGTSRADQDGVEAWVHASEAGSKFFAKEGFRERERLEIDLDEWAKGAEGKGPEEEGRWGKYVFRYMVRKPQAGSRG